MFKVVHKGTIQNLFDTLNLSLGTTRMLKVIALQFFLVHLVACFWYLSATFEENMFATWVGARGIVDNSRDYKYFNAFYWAFQTTTTVGYGDFSVDTWAEYYIAITWMVIGTNFFTFTIGSVSTMIVALDERDRVINQKLNVLLDYTVKHNIPKPLHEKVKAYFEIQQKENTIDQDWETLFDTLPVQLRKDILQFTHGNIIKSIVFFRNKQ